MASAGRFFLPHAALLLLLLLRSSAAVTLPESSIQPQEFGLLPVEIGKGAMKIAVDVFNMHRSSVLTDALLVMCFQLKKNTDHESYKSIFVIKLLARQADRGWVLATFIMGAHEMISPRAGFYKVIPILPFPLFPASLPLLNYLAANFSGLRTSQASVDGPDHAFLHR
ncbi:hypothetical protein AXF42_Ash014487 [Apostasia shenzhenica]|uniref:Uncharacterized protein n=1 Tax=Apostasia shenzhenica TaxID=1088818 RepID=A0A2H9ZWM7_9ASPA|nr:hypothetical protein AXF42_Ash014487 [Apostasia shenzhenica]